MKHIFRTCKLLLLAMLAVPTAAMAAVNDDVSQQCLVITFPGDGASTTVAIALQDNPVVTLDNGNLVVVSANDTLSVPLSGVSYAFETRKAENPTTGINDIAVPGRTAEPQFAFANGTVSGLKAGAKITVYQIGGQVVKSIAADNEGKAELNLSNLPKGIFIIKTPTKSIKIINR